MTNTLPPRQTLRGQQAFTLVELLVVIIIASIVMGASFNMFNTMVLSQRAKTVSFDLYTSLSLARTEAIKRGANVIITRNGSTWGDGWTIKTATAIPLHQHDALTDITITAVVCSTATSVGSVVFTPTGRLDGTQQPCFQVDTPNSTEYSRCVKLDLSGSPRTTKGTCS